MKNSIRGKMISVISFGIIITTIVILIVSCISIGVLSRSDSDAIMEHITEEQVNLMDQDFLQLAQSVDRVADMVTTRIGESYADLTDAKIRKGFMSEMETIMRHEGATIDTVQMAYFRFSTELSEDDEGFIYKRNPASGKMESATLTDLSAYDKDDMKRVGWYYLPKEAGEALWIGPYYNRNFNMNILSYVAPIYAGDTFAGIVGMDISVKEICEDLKDVTIYETGSFTLYDVDNNIVYSRMYPEGKDAENFNQYDEAQLEAKRESLTKGKTTEYKGPNGRVKIFSAPIVSGLTLCTQVPVREIDNTLINVIRIAILVSILILSVAVFLTVKAVKSFLDPLEGLLKAADELSNGNFDTDMIEYDNDEVGKLASAYSSMADLLKRYYSYFHSLGHIDKMTRLNNKTSFAITSNMIDAEIRLKKADFSLVIMDIDNLKNINDSLGPEKGDYLLRRAADILRQSFVGYPLYRVGGDEFCCIVINADPSLLVDQLDRAIKRSSREDEEIFRTIYTVTTGCATFDPERDRRFDDVFNRAAVDMHKNKRRAREKKVEKKYKI